MQKLIPEPAQPRPEGIKTWGLPQLEACVDSTGLESFLRSWTFLYLFLNGIYFILRPFFLVKNEIKFNIVNLIISKKT